MNKEQEIEKMAEVMCPKLHSCEVCDFNGKPCGHQQTAIKLINAGYGNVKKAVKEFAEKLKNDNRISTPTQIFIGGIMDNIITELYGADK